jgi:hypothetical protein
MVPVGPLIAGINFRGNDQEKKAYSPPPPPPCPPAHAACTRAH